MRHWSSRLFTSIVDVRHKRFSLRSVLLFIGIIAVVLGLGAADVGQRRRQAALEQDVLQAIESLGGQSTVERVACEPVWFPMIPKQMRPRVPRRVNVVVLPAFGPEETYEADALTQLKRLRCLRVVCLYMKASQMTLSIAPGQKLRVERIKADMPDVVVEILLR